MPTYEYHCHTCGKDFEYFQSMKDDPITTCEVCGSEGNVERLISAGAGLIFKGSGFYSTDYRSKDYQEKMKAEKETPPSSSKTETKSDKTSDTKSKQAANTTTS